MISHSFVVRHLLAAGTAALIALGLASCGKPAQQAAQTTVTFSILSTESALNSEKYWTPVLADMSAATGLTIKPYFSSNYSLLVDAMTFKKTDIGWFSNQSGLEAVRRADGEVFARTFDPSGVDGYQSVLIVPAKSKVTLDEVLACGKKLNFGIGDVKSTSGTLAPMTYLFAPRGIKPEACFKTVKSANHQANLFAVANGALDVATNNTTTLKLYAQRGGQETSEVKVIWTSPTIPEDPIVWRKDLDPAIKEKVRQFFLTYAQGDSPKAIAERAKLKQLSIGGFKPADDSHLLPVREMEATKLLLEAKETPADTAKIAAAQKALDAIHAERAAAEAKAGPSPVPATAP